MRLAVMYIWVSRDVGHMIDSGSRSVSTVRDLVILPLSVPRKKEAPVCVYCAGHHKSSDCPDKSNPKCANCSARAAPGVSCSHYALSPDCPMMALQRNMVIEGTDLVSSKNL